MKKSQIVVGGIYTAKISGQIVSVRVDAIRESYEYAGALRNERRILYYDVTNLTTKYKTTFRSAAKFRSPAKPHCMSLMSESMALRLNERVQAMRNVRELFAQY